MTTITKQAAIEAVKAIAPSIYDIDRKYVLKEKAIAAINALPAVDERAAIIEKCAVIAETIIGADQYDTMDTDCYQDTADRIAAAIRALTPQ